MPCLLATQGPLFGTTWKIGQELTMGRAAGATIQLVDLQVSRLHATLREQDGQLVLIDASSRNGIFVNDQRVKGERTLAPLDEISVGASRFVFEAPEQILRARHQDAWLIVGGSHPSPETLEPSEEPPPAPSEISLHGFLASKEGATGEAEAGAPPGTSSRLTRLLTELQPLLEGSYGPAVMIERVLAWLMESFGACRGGILEFCAQDTVRPLVLLPAEKPHQFNAQLLERLSRGETLRLRGELPLAAFPSGRRKLSPQACVLLGVPFGQAPRPEGALWLERNGDAVPFSLDELSLIQSLLPMLVSGMAAAVRQDVSLRRDQLELSRLEGTRIPGRQILESAGVLSEARELAQLEHPIAIVGPYGIGKDRVARALHSMSRRWEGPYHVVNCAVLSEDQLRLELFGSEPYPVPGLESGHIGRLEQLSGGTLVLLELESIPPLIQLELLRVLLQREVYRVGAEAPVLVDVRLIVTSSRGPDEWYSEGRLRGDLIQQFETHVLPLPRLEELTELFEPIVRVVIGRMNQRLARRVRGISAAALEWLKGREYPLQLWDLEDLVMRAMTLCESHTLSREDLQAAELMPVDGAVHEGEGGARFSDALKDAEKKLFSQALKLSRGNRMEAAGLLGIPQRQFERKLLEYGLSLR